MYEMHRLVYLRLEAIVDYEYKFDKQDHPSPYIIQNYYYGINKAQGIYNSVLNIVALHQLCEMLFLMFYFHNYLVGFK